MNLEEAQAINKYLGEIVDRANEVLFVANNSTDEELKKAVKHSLGNAITSIDLDIWELIYTQHPALRPPEMIDFKNDDESAK